MKNLRIRLWKKNHSERLNNLFQTQKNTHSWIKHSYNTSHELGVWQDFQWIFCMFREQSFHMVLRRLGTQHTSRMDHLWDWNMCQGVIQNSKTKVPWNKVMWGWNDMRVSKYYNDRISIFPPLFSHSLFQSLSMVSGRTALNVWHWLPLGRFGPSAPQADSVAVSG